MRLHATITAILVFAAAALSAETGDVGEWRLRVQSDAAAVRDEPSGEGQVLARLALGTNLVSQEKTGEWYRVVVTPAGGDMVVMGFVAAGDVKILKFRKEETADFWTEDTAPSRDARLSARFALGGGPVAGNDLSKGFRGRFLSTEAEVLTGGVAIDARKHAPPSPANEFAVDLEYRISRRVSVSFGAGYSWASAKEVLRYHASDYVDRQLDANGTFEMVPLRLSFIYRLPLGRLFSVYGGAGGMYCLVSFQSRQDDVRQAGLVDGIGQTGKSWGLGFLGILGAEAKMTSRACFFLEAQGRLARIGGFEGTETTVYLDSTGLNRTVSRQGSLYFVDDPGGARISILESPLAGNAREVLFDLRSLSVWGGIRLKF